MCGSICGFQDIHNICVDLMLSVIYLNNIKILSIKLLIFSMIGNVFITFQCTCKLVFLQMHLAINVYCLSNHTLESNFIQIK